MNTKRRISFATALLPLVATSVLVQTGAAQAADAEMDACISAFSSYVQKEQPVQVRRVRTVDTPMDLAPNTPVQLTAKSKNGRDVAQATCVITGKEVVLTIDGKPAVRQLALANAQLQSR